MKAYFIDPFFNDIMTESKHAPNVSKVNLTCNNDSVVEIISTNMNGDVEYLKSGFNTIEMRHANKMNAMVSGKSCEERYIPTGAVSPKKNVAANADFGLLKDSHIL